MLTRRLLVPLVAVPFAVGTVLTGTASAVPTGAVALGPQTSIEGTSPALATALPNASIVKPDARPVHWNKTSLAASRKSFTTCSSAYYVATLTNNTSVSQPIKRNGRLLGTLAKHSRVGVCAKGPSAFSGSFVLGRNPNSKLVVHYR